MSKAAMFRFLDGKAPAPLPPDPDGYVRKVSLTVAIIDGRAMAVIHAEFSTTKVTADGMYIKPSQNESHALLRAVWAHQSRREKRAATGEASNVVDAELRFMLGKGRWRPTKADMAALREDVRQRAGGLVLWPEDLKKAGLMPRGD